MTEQDKKKSNKPRWIGRILKWIALTLLAILIILAIIFQAPGKVVTLLLIILTACTVLPKPYRKWFWLSVAAIVLILIIWVFLPEDSEGWRPYTFDEEFDALEAKYAIPDSENAAKIYNKLLEDYNESALYTNLSYGEQFRLRKGEALLSEDKPKVSKWMKQHKTTVEELLKASEIEKCRFPLNPQSMNSTQRGKRLNAMRNWAILLTTTANIDFREGRTDEAFEKLIAILQMGKHENQQGSIVDILVGIAVQSRAISQFKNFIIDGDASEEHLILIRKPLVEIKHDWKSDLPRLLECGRLFAKSSLARMFYQIDKQGRIRFSRDPYVEWRVDFEKRVKTGRIDKKEVFDLWKLWVFPSYFQKKVIRSKTIINWFLMPSTPQKAAKIVDALYERYAPMSDPAFDWKKEWEEASTGFDYECPRPFKQMLRILEPPLYSFHNLYLKSIAEQRGVRIIIALRRYKNKTGHWPEQLDDIKSTAPAEIFVDPFNNDSFVYKLKDSSFTLYSKGNNNIDENGRGDYRDFEGADDFLIWPP